MEFNPYLVFDVPMSADAALLRATYRRLARDNHPDISPDKAAATERMARINRAWGILGDPTRRADFDAALRRHNDEHLRRESARREAMRGAQREAMRVAQTSGNSHPAAREAQREAARRELARGTRGAGANGTSQPAARGSKSQSGRPANSKPAPSSAKRAVKSPAAGSALASALARNSASALRRVPETEPGAAQIRVAGNEASAPALRMMRRITLASRLFHRDGNDRAAIDICRAVLITDTHNGPARELLAEIFASQGRLELAVMMLDQAIQLAPDDLFLRRKRQNLEASRFSTGHLRPAARPSLWQRLRARLKTKTR